MITLDDLLVQSANDIVRFLTSTQSCITISLKGSDKKNALLKLADILQRSVKLPALEPTTKTQELEKNTAQRVQKSTNNVTPQRVSPPLNSLK